MKNNRTAIIIGAGPAGLTAAYELLKRTDIHPIILEATDKIGGISRTENYEGNRIDIGGHRFFSKSVKVMKWWQAIFPVLEVDSTFAKNQKFYTESDEVFLVRERVSRIFYGGKFYDYPITLSISTLVKLGLMKTFKIGFSYIWIRVFPRKNEKSLEDFFINRFGTELYQTFFKNYTEKVWGISCKDLSADWGAQRIKELSITRIIIHALKKIFHRKPSSIDQKDTDTSLIERFIYPKFGPGQLWEKVLEKCIEMGADVHFNHEVISIAGNDHLIKSVKTKDKTFEADYVISTMPIRELVQSFDFEVPDNIKEISDNLIYRDFITIGVLADRLKIKNQTEISTINGLIPDNWIYIQDDSVKVGRIQIFNNWSPFMVEDAEKVWIGMEYFCNDTDEFWNRSDSELVEFGINELVKINFLEKDHVIKTNIIRSPKAYPVYYGAYEKMDIVVNFVNQIENLFLIGRNGMHRYNNMDHSMLTAMTAVDNIIEGQKDKQNIWNVNAEKEYHEEK